MNKRTPHPLGDGDPTLVSAPPGGALDTTLAAGTMVGDIRLARPIGSGLSSEVYEGHNLAARKHCAVKVFRSALAPGTVSRGRYVHLARQVAALEHPGIAQVYSFDRGANGRLVTIGELVAGSPLSSILREHGPLSRRRYLPIVRQICGALAAAHARQLPHLRLHPGNVMVRWTADDALEVKLLDFGVCQLHPPLNEPIASLDPKPSHAFTVAPEQAKGEAGDSRSDVYALSVMLYQMVSGEPPFRGESYTTVLEQHLTASPPAPSERVTISSELDETILRGLEKDPRRRTPSVEALLSALDPVSASTGRHQVRARSRHGHHRTLSTAEFRVAQAGQGRQRALTEPTGKIPSSKASRRHLLRERWMVVAALATTIAILATLFSIC